MITNVQANGHSAEATVENLDIDSLEEKILSHLPDLSPEQSQRMVKLIKGQNQLHSFFDEFPEQLNKFELPMHHIDKSLKYDKPFKVAIVAVTGAGKSTLLNSMLARDLVLVKNVGGAATGCALYLYQDLPDGAPETATITYRDEKSIRRLVTEYFVKTYSLNDSNLAGPLNEGFASIIAQMEPSQTLSKDAQRDFDELKQTLIDLIQQYARHNPDQLQQTFNLESSDDKRRLLELIDEGSPANHGMNRKIGLVEAVNYHIRSGKSFLPDASALNLPPNVCLVDLPGLDGTCLHNIIIREGIEEADAVLFVVHPRRFQTLNNTELLSRISRFVTSENDPHSS
ncbi:MAG: hypothetical protein F6K11_16680, partial [Leptolyngbya sp. SIO3F4]|nr:hypothetical protein [Leptolyngbya sp. SIO3F4]